MVRPARQVLIQLVRPALISAPPAQRVRLAPAIRVSLVIGGTPQPASAKQDRLTAMLALPLKSRALVSTAICYTVLTHASCAAPLIVPFAKHQKQRLVLLARTGIIRTQRRTFAPPCSAMAQAAKLVLGRPLARHASMAIGRTRPPTLALGAFANRTALSAKMPASAKHVPMASM